MLPGDVRQQHRPQRLARRDRLPEIVLGRRAGRRWLGQAPCQQPRLKGVRRAELVGVRLDVARVDERAHRFQPTGRRSYHGPAARLLLRWRYHLSSVAGCGEREIDVASQ